MSVILKRQFPKLTTDPTQVEVSSVIQLAADVCVIASLVYCRSISTRNQQLGPHGFLLGTFHAHLSATFASNVHRIRVYTMDWRSKQFESLDGISHLNAVRR